MRGGLLLVLGSEPAPHEPRAPTASKRRWPAIRAALIAFAILVGTIDGCPLPPEPHVTAAQRPFVDVLRPVQQKALAPFTWITRGLRFSQRWALMQVGPRERLRFTVEGRTSVASANAHVAPTNPSESSAHAPRTWVVLYRANDPDHDTFADVLETHHVWGVWNPTDRPMGQYPAFVRWFTAHVLAERPDLAAVRTKYEKVILEDGELRATGEFTSAMTRERGAR
ncbi:MAG: hypothetical protein ACKV2T_27790 [Kofleriaceae bacterium]